MYSPRFTGKPCRLTHPFALTNTSATAVSVPAAMPIPHMTPTGGAGQPLTPLNTRVVKVDEA